MRFHDLAPLWGSPKARPVTARARVLDMRASFGNFRESGPHYDASGKLIKGKGIIYTPGIPALWPTQQDRLQRWLDVLAANGNTHLVIGDFEGGEGYPGSEYEFPDYTADLPMLAEMVGDLVTRPAADGDGWRLMVQMDGGSDGYQDRVKKWPAIVKALEPFKASILWSPGWELIRASSWTSKAYGDGAALLRSLIGPEAIMIAHLSPGRNAFSSNPLEADDPWQGSESACWTDARFRFDAIFYQAEPPNPDDHIERCKVRLDGKQLLCSQHADVVRDGEVVGTTCPLDRVWDSLFRTGCGQMGVPRLEKWILGETCIYPGWHQGIDVDAFGTLIADVVERELLPLARRFAPDIQISFGNGLPSRLRS